MKYFSLTKLSLITLSASISLGFFTFLLGVYWFRFGIWPQSEPVITFFYLMGGLVAFSLLLFSFTKYRRVLRAAIFHPFALGPYVIFIFSLLTTPFHPLWVRHLIGSPYTGEGTFFWGNMGVLISGAILSCKIPSLRNITGIIAIIALAINTFLQFDFQFRGDLTVPLYYSDYLAFSFFAILPVILVLLHPLVVHFIKPEKYFECLLWVVIAASVATLCAISQNNVGTAYSILGIGFFVACLRLVPLSKPHRTLLAQIGLASIAPIFLIILVVCIHIPGAQDYYVTNRWGPISTVFSRAYLIDMVWQPLIENPLRVFVGLGWGSFGEIVSGYLPTSWVDFTGEKGTWDGVTTDHFHSHNIFVEMLSNAGLPAMVMLYVWIASIPFFAKSSQKIAAFVFAGALAGIGSFWFMMPHNINFITIGLGFLARNLNNSKIHMKLSRSKIAPQRLFLSLLALGLFFCAGIIFSTMYHTDQYIPPAFQKAGNYTSCKLDYQDHGAGGSHLARLMTLRLRIIGDRLSRKKEATDIKALMTELRKDTVQLTNMFCQAGLYRQAHAASKKLDIARLLVRGEALLSLQEVMDAPMRTYYAQGWEEELDAWLNLYPARTDLVVPYLLWALLNKHDDAVNRMANHLYDMNPNNPVALWFSGLSLTTDEQTSLSGLTRMRRALNLGIERFTPIDPAVKQQLLSLPDAN